MNIKNFSTMILLLSLSTSVFAVTVDPLIGKWKTIDDRTGYSLTDVLISKDDKSQQYMATIINTRNVPGAAKLEICTQCTGAEKNKSLVGLEILTGLTAVAGTKNEFRSGQLLDPNNGQHYAARAKLITNGKHLIIYGKSGQSTVGRNITWVKN
jgi:uncharacterized protein (DUF2147 family)